MGTHCGSADCSASAAPAGPPLRSSLRFVFACGLHRGALVLLGFALHVVYYTMVPVDATKGGKKD